MRRAILTLFLGLAPCALFVGSGLAQENQVVNGIGLFDFGHGPRFKFGSWVRYHVTGRSSRGTSQDYLMTVGIGGEERFWGEDCFWVETITEPKDGGPQAVATLMSYSIFSDSLAMQHLEFYTRKNVTDSDVHGEPVESVAKRPGNSLRVRPRPAASHWYTDTLGTDTIRVAKGVFRCRKVRIKQDVGNEIEHPDSTFFSETRENRDSYYSPEVPISGIVREDIENTQTKKAWLVGRSQEAVTAVTVHSVARAELVDFGDGYEAQVIGVSKRHSMKDEPAETAGRPAAPPRAPAGKTSARKPG